MNAIDPYHCWAPDKEWCLACRKSRYEVVDKNLPCYASRMFYTALELGIDK